MLLSSFFYALYHFFVVLVFVSVFWAVIATVALIFTGFVFIFLHAKFGFLTASLFHMSADIVIMIALANIFWLFIT